MSDATRPVVSVCMAAYNGARWLPEQLGSILEQLAPHDEVVVVDDASTDDTRAVLAAVEDGRVRVLQHPRNLGYVRTFADAMAAARGDVLLLADQDDVWEAGRVGALVAALHGSDVVAGNVGVLGGPDALRGPYGQRRWRLRSSDSRRRVRNVLGILAGNRPYYGCAMGLRREALDRVLPFPPYLTESHDLWIALYGNLAGSITHLDQVVLRRRFHDSNASPSKPRGVVAALRSRLLLLRCTAEVLRRRRRRASVRQSR